jgi:hypothetical protein
MPSRLFRQTESTPVLVDNTSKVATVNTLAIWPASLQGCQLLGWPLSHETADATKRAASTYPPNQWQSGSIASCCSRRYCTGKCMGHL